jgi:hypothetical protein
MKKGESSLEGHVKEVERRLERAARGIGRAAAEKLGLYRGTKRRHLGLTVPQQRAEAERGYRFSRLPGVEQLIVWDAVWHRARHHEGRMQALMFLEGIREEKALRRIWTVVRGWAHEVDSWDAADDLSGVYARILEVMPGRMYPTLCKWNRSANAWLRRLSIVSLLHYAGSRTRVLAAGKVFPLVRRLLNDGDRFVQKAIGWTLREAHRVYPADTERFVRRHLMELTGAAFGEATRRWPGKKRAELMRRRKIMRGGAGEAAPTNQNKIRLHHKAHKEHEAGLGGGMGLRLSGI